MKEVRCLLLCPPHPITTAAFVFVSIKSQTPSSDQMLLLGVLGEAWRCAPLIPASGSRGRRSSGLERVPGLQREALTVKGERSGENVSVGSHCCQDLGSALSRDPLHR